MISTFPKTERWAVRQAGVEYAWFRYSRKEPPKLRDEDYLAWCAFQSAYAAGWLEARGLDPDFNIVVFQ